MRRRRSWRGSFSRGRIIHHAHARPHPRAPRYGVASLESLPANATLLAHSDLLWNSARYLQACEGRRPDVTLVMLQLLPFPWFQRQRHLYAGFSAPPIRAGVSLDLADPGYRRLVLDTIESNAWLARAGRLFLGAAAMVGAPARRVPVGSGAMAYPWPPHAGLTHPPDSPAGGQQRPAGPVPPGRARPRVACRRHPRAPASPPR